MSQQSINVANNLVHAWGEPVTTIKQHDFKITPTPESFYN